MNNEHSINSEKNRLLLEEGHMSIDQIHNQQENQATVEEMENSCVAMQCMMGTPSEYLRPE